MKKGQIWKLREIHVDKQDLTINKNENQKQLRIIEQMKQISSLNIFFIHLDFPCVDFP